MSRLTRLTRLTKDKLRFSLSQQDKLRHTLLAYQTPSIAAFTSPNTPLQQLWRLLHRRPRRRQLHVLPWQPSRQLRSWRSPRTSRPTRPYPASLAASAWPLGYFFWYVLPRPVITRVHTVLRLCSQVPQLVLNYRTGSADGISLSFLFVWLVGDLTNLSGEFASRALLLDCCSDILHQTSISYFQCTIQRPRLNALVVWRER